MRGKNVMAHAMIDIETLSLRKNAVILSIGAIRFDEDNISLTSLEAYPFVQAQIAEGRHVDYETIKFWKSQAIPLPYENAPLHHVLTLLCEFIKTDPTEQVWCNGLNYDIAILEQVMMEYSIPIPWKYNMVRDTRTLWEVVGLDVKKEERQPGEEAHTALGDALFQARMVQKAWKMLGRSL